MKKQPYTITALITPNPTPQRVDSCTGLERHALTHSAGIPQFHLTENHLIALSIHITATPDPIDPNLPETRAQNAAIAQLRAEAHARYPKQQIRKYKLYQTASATP